MTKIISSSVLRLSLFISFFLIINSLHAQERKTVIYDVIHMKDGRVLKGEILAFEQKDGDITFMDNLGRKYSITRKEYEYFVEDMTFSVRNKDTLVIKSRKEFEFEFSVGLSVIYNNFSHSFTPDDYYLSSSWNGSYAFVPLCLKVGAGKYLNRKNYVGITSDIAFMSEASPYFNVGLKYAHHYDAYKNNVALYIPVELQFNSIGFGTTFNVADTTFSNVEGISDTYPSSLEIKNSIQSMGISIGHGMAFIMDKKRSLALELSFFKNFILSHKFSDLSHNPPKSSYKNGGLKLSVFFNI